QGGILCLFRSFKSRCHNRSFHPPGKKNLPLNMTLCKSQPLYHWQNLQVDRESTAAQNEFRVPPQSIRLPVIFSPKTCQKCQFWHLCRTPRIGVTLHSTHLG